MTRRRQPVRGEGRVCHDFKVAGQIEVFSEGNKEWRWRIVGDGGHVLKTSDLAFMQEEEARQDAVVAMAANPFLPPLPDTEPGPTPQGDA